MTVVFAGGGTGGHLYPAIAIADALRQRGANIAFVGSADRLETTIVPKAGYPLYSIAAHSLPRRPSLRFFGAIAANAQGIAQSLRLLSAVRPDLVVATGGYVCFPVAVAARMRRLARLSRAPIVLVEPNAAPGLTNRLLAPIVDEVWRSVPIRASLRRLPPREEAASRLGLDPSRRTLVAVGGSQGARAINDALLGLVAAGGIPNGWQLLHLTGDGDYQRVAAQHPPVEAPAVVRSYLEDMADAYSVADLLLTRGGASTLGELRALGKPAIVVPYPFAAEGHQAANAAALEEAGAVVMLSDRELHDGRLAGVLAAATQERRLAELRENARRMQGSDPLAGILARIESLVPRKNER
ncbi:MAG: UDP-N-acetylglucosamine--N-acetylmuramyl-(pentapeptide) pyrophosphoryl-undecaprenol N-acetylglucosamine transferase [Candidatus Eremiobacteraeota bacterium]|nr:UDP-N-acetylglucosamine--N-acetylmuramyl-(pentapeptide) pyrophosphoryl-undecaprenol N-acetylglucosamine transferase [Candidatus Eremiobacteraeota bacterium]MBV8500080.1 UDP-N-acetylglucosamine--N-acetylmuramyl-(pentapeptide) pyrophosphoryl-undecaprenol N-acetylglucosamine transferase [Candidatus Eremiobacteraeota bacterium]